MPGTLPGTRSSRKIRSWIGRVSASSFWVSHVRAISCAGPERGVGSIEEEREVFGRRRGWTIGQRSPCTRELRLAAVVDHRLALRHRVQRFHRSVRSSPSSCKADHWSSRCTRRGLARSYLRAAIALVVLSAIAPVIVSSSSSDALQLAIGSSIRLTLSLAAMAAILRRATQHARVDGEILLAALCIYLLLGMLFSAGVRVDRRHPIGPVLRPASTTGRGWIACTSASPR